ncbi:hypothetical protein C7W88_17290 (plasmid) [Novosphingobium sp. THN1]|nr:hypothetical protein C7W88_17290 [Novosphingobium sp. THN1]
MEGRLQVIALAVSVVGLHRSGVIRQAKRRRLGSQGLPPRYQMVSHWIRGALLRLALATLLQGLTITLPSRGH